MVKKKIYIYIIYFWCVALLVPVARCQFLDVNLVFIITGLVFSNKTWPTPAVLFKGKFEIIKYFQMSFLCVMTSYVLLKNNLKKSKGNSNYRLIF